MKKSYVTPWLKSVDLETDNVLTTSLGGGYVDGSDTVFDYDKIGGFGL